MYLDPTEFINITLNLFAATIAGKQQEDAIILNENTIRLYSLMSIDWAVKRINEILHSARINRDVWLTQHTVKKYMNQRGKPSCYYTINIGSFE